MANFLLNNVFRISVNTLNFVSPSIVADILLHPFDFATVLLQIGFNPEGNKYETATLVSVIVQYAIFTFYIPYLLTSMQGLQFMGMPHPSIFYYVSYIYNKEGFRGCYRGLMPKICERVIMVSVNERVRRSINRGFHSYRNVKEVEEIKRKEVNDQTSFDNVRNTSSETENEWEEENFLQNLINGICSQFFAVLASHPFHVIMVSSFAEFTYDKKSTILELSHSIYKGDGYFGFFTGLTARLLGELLSLIFSVAYTTIINKQTRPQQAAETSIFPSSQKTADHLVNYVTDLSRFTAFKPKSIENEELEVALEEDLERTNTRVQAAQPWFSQYYEFLSSFLGNLTQNSSPVRSHLQDGQQPHRRFSLLEYIPLTSRLFYYIMIRDFLSKKISNPFFLVCHCAIVLDTGWDKFPLLTYLETLGVSNFIQVQLTPSEKGHRGKGQLHN